MKSKQKTPPSTEQILEALRGIIDPGTGRGIVTAGMVKSAQADAAGDIVVTIEVDPARGSALEPMRQTAELILSALPGVKKAAVILTAEQKPAPDPHGMGKNPVLSLPIRHIIAVASGKGGVGKSTIASNLAVALAQTGLSTGLLDADIYGPSQPRMMGVEGRKPVHEGEKIEPLRAHGVKMMSIGLMVDPEKALVWRGPMVQSALYQLLRDVNWGSADAPLDILVVDMPPGTGDAQLTLAQKVPLAGAVIVSTPQDIALLDARKGVEMFRAVKVPVLGIIENMSVFTCPQCGHDSHIFDHGGARREAERLGIPFLGEIPLTMDMRIQGDAGIPLMASAPESPAARVFSEIAQQLKKTLGKFPA
ncbi:MAG: Mrp/NBP35 family ATP-binding protein [Alphaproteobacteria bacterium]|nr:Mrp/NBP35 family ATP-binding protein [Alphaproteobacteria bacterium]